jgi:subtilisin family serine protease
MATPYVAGIAAIMKSVDKNITQDKVLDYLKRGTAKPSDIVERSEVGRVDLYATLVAFANDKGIADVEKEFTPEAKTVDAPETAQGNDGDLVSSLFSAICQ